ncbi:hypothetical protein PR003_g13357 [Phytophthora rubi]|uniref:Uncharacterized protein n=1 Tax=Phytophthora rubi TaxID=129364 RepID=A0A6A4F6W5_9STRA|nr:hypothetical protein PR002_g11913 [Phytophthora rubi]KAE9334778.1 hypothetical protein PR003_g13357 [Phytophthora rubi]
MWCTPTTPFATTTPFEKDGSNRYSFWEKLPGRKQEYWDQFFQKSGEKTILPLSTTFQRSAGCLRRISSIPRALDALVAEDTPAV